METKAIILDGARSLRVDSLTLTPPADGDVVVDIRWSGISTGTEKLFWSGTMPPFPGMGYPLVPGYESVGEVVEAAPATGLRPGDSVFVPGATCYQEARGLFGGAAARVVARADRLARLDSEIGARGVLLALASTARHAMAGLDRRPPDLVVGHGVVGRLLARLAILAGAAPPTVWEVEPRRFAGAEGYQVLAPEDDDRRDYRSIYDATGDPSILNALMGRLAKGGEIVLAGFYAEPISFAFPPAFMKEARIRVAAEWTPDDLAATRELIEGGALSLDGLLTHQRPASDGASAYAAAFEDPDCLKMCLDWRAA